MNAFDEMRNAVQQARAVNRTCDEHVNTMLDLIDGRLINANPHRLATLKKQLQGFNAKTGRWAHTVTTK